jgi:hypothetical protein
VQQLLLKHYALATVLEKKRAKAGAGLIINYFKCAF